MTSVVVVVAAVQLWGYFLGQATLYAAPIVPSGTLTTGQPAICGPGTGLVSPSGTGVGRGHHDATFSHVEAEI